jgi:hypothetical protein
MGNLKLRFTTSIDFSDYRESAVMSKHVHNSNIEEIRQDMSGNNKEQSRDECELSRRSECQENTAYIEL